MKDIVITEVNPKDQRYQTVGDWFEDAASQVIIAASKMGNDDYTFLVALHELVEWYLCQKRGITQEQVDAFDQSWESDRYDEPGDDPAAPYHVEHAFAYGIEYLMATELGVEIYAYDDAVKKADKEAQK